VCSGVMGADICRCGLGYGCPAPAWGHGCSFQGQKVWAPHGSLVKVELKRAEAVSVEETIELAKGDNCIWYGEAPSATAGDHYRFVLDSSWNDCLDTEGAALYRRVLYDTNARRA